MQHTPDKEIVEILKSEFPEYKHATTSAISYYRNFIRKGKMEKMGFTADQIEPENNTTKKKATRKVATRKK